MRRSRDAARTALYDVAALAVRLGAGWVFAEHAARRLGDRAVPVGPFNELGVPHADTMVAAWPYAGLACAVAFLVGLLTPVTGTALAGATAYSLWTSLGGTTGALDDASGIPPGLLTVLASACLVAAVRPGRLALDRVVFARRARRRRVTGGDREARDPGVVPRRPEHAPPLLYPEGRAAVRRPSRT